MLKIKLLTQLVTQVFRKTSKKSHFSLSLMSEKLVVSRKKSKMFEYKILSNVAFDLNFENECLHKKIPQNIFLQ